MHDNFEETELFTTLDHPELISGNTIYLIDKIVLVGFLRQFIQTSMKCIVIATKIFKLKHLYRSIW